MRFEWDGVKAALNLVKHGISFDESMAVFDDAHALYQDDVSHSQIEQRQRILGRVSQGIVSVVYTQRGNLIRLISSRPASRHERKFYASAQR